MTYATTELDNEEGRHLLAEAMRLRSIRTLLDSINGYLHTEPSPERNARMLHALAKAKAKFNSTA